MNNYNKAIFPGSFDPIHMGHLDVILRAKKDYPNLLVVVANNTEKKHKNTFTQRLKKVTKELQEYDIKVIGLEKGLLANLASEQKTNIILRGYRSKSEKQSELEMFEVNKSINNKLALKLYKSKRRFRNLSSTKINESKK